MNSLEKTGIVAIIIGFIGLALFSPILVFAFSYVGGLFLKWIFGGLISNGISMLFNVEFNSNLIPITFATIATIGSCFKTVNTNTNNNNNNK